MRIIIAILLSGVLMSNIGEKTKVVNEKIKFEIRKGFWTVNGTFETIQSKIVFDEENLRGSKIYGKAEVKSINTGSKQRDNHITSEKDWLDAANFPSLELSSKSIKKTVENNFLGEFELYLKGKKQNIEAPIVLKKSGNTINLESTFTLKRSDFNIGSGNFLIGDEIVVFLSADLQ